MTTLNENILSSFSIYLSRKDLNSISVLGNFQENYEKNVKRIIRTKYNNIPVTMWIHGTHYIENMSYFGHYEYINNINIEDGFCIYSSFIGEKYVYICVNGRKCGEELCYGIIDDIKFLKERSTFVKGIRQGKYFKYYQNGKVRVESNYVNGFLNGELKSFSLYGTLESVINYVDDLEEGLSFYYGEDGYLHYTQNYEKGIMYGERISYYQNGNKKVIGICIKENYNGKYEEFYENGTLKVSSYLLGDTTEEGSFHGKYEEFYENGKIKINAFYITGTKEGKYIEYDKEGNIVLEQEYINNILQE